jgi:hypothetical protein
VNGLIWFWPGVAVAVAMSWLLAPVVGRALRIDRRLAWLLVFSIGLIVAATITPIRPPIGIDLTIHRNCDFGRRWFATIPEVTAWTGSTLHIGAFVPAGVAIALLPISLRSAIVVVCVAALPGAVEALHFAVPELARACKSADAIDGLTGLATGMIAGLVIRVALGAWNRVRA